MSRPSARVGDRVTILRGRWCGRTALVVDATDTSVKVSFTTTRWYGRSEVETCL